MELQARLEQWVQQEQLDLLELLELLGRQEEQQEEQQVGSSGHMAAVVGWIALYNQYITNQWIRVNKLNYPLDSDLFLR